MHASIHLLFIVSNVLLSDICRKDLNYYNCHCAYFSTADNVCRIEGMTPEKRNCLTKLICFSVFIFNSSDFLENEISHFK